MSFQRFKGADGKDLIINTAHVIGVTTVNARTANGAAPATQVIGKSMVMMTNGTSFVVDGSVLEVYGALLKESRSTLLDA